MVARILKRILNVQQIKKSRLHLSSRKSSDKSNPGDERLQTDDLLLIDESDVTKAIKNETPDPIKLDATNIPSLTHNTRDSSFNNEVKTQHTLNNKVQESVPNLYSKSEVVVKVKEEIGKIIPAITATTSAESTFVDEAPKNSNKKPLNDFIPTFIPTVDRKLNIGRKDESKKKEREKNNKTLASNLDNKPSMRMGPTLDCSTQMGDSKLVPKHGSTLPRIGDIPDLISIPKSNENNRRNFGFSTMESLLNAKNNVTKHSHKLDIRKVDESEQEQHFKISPLDTVHPLLPGYHPIPTDKQIPLTMPPKSFTKPITKVSSYDTVPGPAVLKAVGHYWSYIPMIGTQFVATFLYTIQSVMSSVDRRLKYPSVYPYYYLFNKYGPMVRLNSPLGADILILAVNGEEFPLIHTKVIDNEVQSLFDSLNAYRKNAPILFSSVDLPNLQKSQIPGNPMLEIDQYYETIEKNTDQFIRRGGSFIIGYTGENQERNHENDLLKWALQSTMDVYFKNNWEILENTTDSNLFETFQKVSRSLRLSETGIQLWRFFNTFTWLDLIEHCKSLDRYIAEVASNCLTGIGDGKPNGSVLEALVLTEELNPSDMLTPLLDLLIINVYAVASTSGFLLYHLAKNPQVQRNVYREICSVMPKGGGPINQADLAKLKYLNACITETLRMAPTFPILSRELEEDTDIQGIQIPSGTYIQMVNVLPCTKGNYAGEEIGRFQAERWMEDGSELGGDALIGLPKWNSFPNFNKDLVLTQIALLVAKIVREYRIDYPHTEIYSDGMVLAGPTTPFNFTFLERII